MTTDTEGVCTCGCKEGICKCENCNDKDCGCGVCAIGGCDRCEMCVDGCTKHEVKSN